MGIFTGTGRDDVIRGTSGVDIILALGGNDTIFGGEGLDTIDGGDGDDVIYANDSTKWSDGALNVLSGGAGNDVIYAGLGDVANGGTGFDILNIDLSSSGLLGRTVDFRAMTLLDLGGELTLSIDGTQLSGFEAVGELGGTAGDDDFIIGNRGGVGSTVNAGDGDDRVRASGEADKLDGGTGNDVLSASGGKDTLIGGEGDDRLTGGRGQDKLTGGEGADVFQFLSTRDSANGSKHADLITDFNHAEHDRIGLNRIDAIEGTASNDAFHFIGSDAFSGTAGELRSVTFHGDTFVTGDTNGDGKADFTITLHGELDLVAKDFIL